MKISVSEIQDYMRCPYRWYCRWVKNRVPQEEAPALAFGRLLHEVFECAAEHSMEKALTEVPQAWYNLGVEAGGSELSYRMRALDELKEFAEPLSLWTPEKAEILEVETPFEYKYGAYTLLGRPDTVILLDNYVYHRQHKGLAAATNFGTYLLLAKRSMHEHLYGEALHEKYPQYKYGGTYFNLMRKLKFRTHITKKKPEGKVKSLDQMFFQHPVPIDLGSKLHADVMENLYDWVKRIDNERFECAAGMKPAINELQNGGPYGNSPDLYFRVLIGEISLDDDRYFKDRIDMYARNTEE